MCGQPNPESAYASTLSIQSLSSSGQTKKNMSLAYNPALTTSPGETVCKQFSHFSPVSFKNEDYS